MIRKSVSVINSPSRDTPGRTPARQRGAESWVGRADLVYGQETVWLRDLPICRPSTGAECARGAGMTSLEQRQLVHLTHLQRLEAESIQIMREVVAVAENPVMLYSIGKDSAVMLHLAMKAFYPASRRSRCCTSTRPGSSATCTRSAIAWRPISASTCSCTRTRTRVARGINPFTHGSAVHTDIWKTEGLKQALDQVRVRRRLRRGAPRRGEVARQGARVLVPLRAAPLGSEEPAPRAVAALQRAEAAGRVDPRVPALELDRARRLALHLPRGHSRSCRCTSRRSGRSSSATAR